MSRNHVFLLRTVNHEYPPALGRQSTSRVPET